MLKKIIKKENSQGEIIIYKSDDGEARIEVKMENETVWLSQKQMAELFGKSKKTISEHNNNIFDEKELDKNSTVRKFRTVQVEGGRKVEREIEFYSLDVIISVGYRVKSTRGIQFRIWATKRLKEYIVKGFTMDDERLKGSGGGNYWKELLDRIRDIRSSEKVLYRQVLDLYATSIDYNPRGKESILFFKTVQNKLHYASHGKTAAEVIMERANADKPFMGLLTFSGKDVIKKDVSVAKNYLSEEELKVLNNIVSAYFDMAEVKAMNHNPMNMKDWIEQLDKMIELFDKKLLSDAGTVSHKEAIKKAEKEYKKYQAKTLSPVEKDYLEVVKNIQKKIKNKKSNE
jgi:hypothetical protein